MRRALFLATALLLVFSACDAPSKDEVPSAGGPREIWRIKGSRLESEGLNFRISSPEGWEWLEDTAQRVIEDEQHSFVARSDEQTFFRLTVRSRGLFENSPESVAGYLRGVEISSHKNGITLANVASRPRASQAGPGYAYSYEMQLPQGVILADGYVLAADRFYMLQYLSTDRAELAAFERFIDSLELIDRVK